jgi:hypothetical protein
MSIFGQSDASIIHYFNGTVSSNSIQNNKKSDENCNSAQPVRASNGSCNNMDDGDWGKAQIPFHHMLTPDYGTNGEMSGQNRQNARTISNLICHQEAGVDVLSERGLSAMVYTFFQFVDHNITATMEGHTEFEPISVPMNDPFFDPNGTGSQMIPFMRSMKMMDENGMPHQINLLSSWIDGAGIYGANEFRANWLRSFQNGKLKQSENGFLPCNTITGNCADPIDTLAPFMAGNENSCGNFQKIFVAGDVRANEQPGLLAFHTLFVKEHNLICDELQIQGFTDDEIIYQKAKRMVIGKFQAIVYNELLPALGIHLDNYNGYDEDMNPDIYSIFSTAAFRLGHTMVMDNVLLLDNNCQPIISNTGCGPVDGDCSCYTNDVNVNGSANIKDIFFHPSFVKNTGIEPILKGLSVQTQQEIDEKVVNALRNFLFGAPGAGGLDLAALNIQRGRDHALPDYNTVRQYFTGQTISSFSEITNDVDLQNALTTAYNNVNDIDLFVGLLAEQHLANSSVGITLHAILKDQFTRLRNCDRYFYKIDPMLSDNERTKIKNTRFSDLIKRNSSLSNISNNVFYSRKCSNDSAPHFFIKTINTHHNTFFDIPIQVENFKNIFEIDIDITWDDTQLQFDQLVQFNISDGSFSTQNNNSTFNIKWSNYQNGGNSITDNLPIAMLRFKVISNQTEIAKLDIEPVFMASTAGNAPIYEVIPNERDGEIHIGNLPNNYSLSGSVTTPTGFSVEDVKVNFLKNNQIASYYYVENGQTMFEKAVVSNGSDFEYNVESVSYDCGYCSNLNVLDAVLLNEHLLNNRSLESPYAYLAADVNENQTIENADLIETMALMLRKQPTFTNQNYQFFSTEFQPTLANPYNLINERAHDDINKYLYAQNFMGVPKGKIIEMDDYRPTTTLVDNEIKILERSELHNDTISIPISAFNFDAIKGFQLTVEWNAEVLEFHQIIGERLTDFSDVHLDIKEVNEGKLGVAWFHPNGETLQLLNGENFIELQFIVKGQTGDFSNIHITNALREIMLITEDLQIQQPVFDVNRVKVVEKIAGNDNIFQLVIFPNPTPQDFELQFQLEIDGMVEIDILNALGQQTKHYSKEKNAGLHQIPFNETSLSTGIYFIRFKFGGEIVTKRLVIQ